MQFVKLTEENEWEGETWRFWLQVDSNEAALIALRGYLAQVEKIYEGGEPGSPLTLSPLDDPKDEAYVDALVEQAEEDEGGYMAADQKITGVLKLPDWPDPQPGEYDNQILRDLYKGGIAKLFRETAPA